MSGRRLRKLPFMAHIHLCGTAGDVLHGVKLGRYLTALAAAVKRETDVSQVLA